MTEEKRESFVKIVEPVIEWINNNMHPHAKIIIETNKAELVEGRSCHLTNEYILD